MIIAEYGNSINVTQRPATQATAYRAAYLDLRSRWPNVDFDIVSDAAMQMAADAANVAEEVEAKPGIGFDEPDPEFVLEARIDRQMAVNTQSIIRTDAVLAALKVYYHE